jgi:hypothetical protein
MWAMNNGNDWLDEELHRAAQDIPDDGFTARVMQALPARRARANLRSWILLASALLALAVGIFGLHTADGIMLAFQAILSFSFTPATISLAAAAVLVLGTLVWGTVALARDEM